MVYGHAEGIDVCPWTLIPIGKILFYGGIGLLQDSCKPLPVVIASDGSEIDQFRLCRTGQKDIIRADIPVDQALTVKDLKDIQKFSDIFRQLGPVHLTVLFHVSPQINP